MIRWAVLGLSQDEDWTYLFENFTENSLKVHKREKFFVSDFDLFTIL
jgi:hypothetical protein